MFVPSAELGYSIDFYRLVLNAFLFVFTKALFIYSLATRYIVILS
jgi:hypothetical protein